MGRAHEVDTQRSYTGQGTDIHQWKDSRDSKTGFEEKIPRSSGLTDTLAGLC